MIPKLRQQRSGNQPEPPKSERVFGPLWYTGTQRVGLPNLEKEGNRMAKKPQKSGTAWTNADKKELRTLINQNTPTRVMGLKLKRTPGAVQSKANHLGLSTKPTNQSPYNRRKKK